MIMKMDNEQILRQRMHGLYLSRTCEDIVELSRELLGLHCWFHRNVVFSAVIRGADIGGWRGALTKTWLYRGTLHGVAYDDLPRLLALHAADSYLAQFLGVERMNAIADEVVSLMEDGVYSRAQMRRIFAGRLDRQEIDAVFSPWGGIFVYLARQGKVAFRNMTSRDFDLISAEPAETPDDVLPGLLRRYFKAYGPATLADATWFFGLDNDARRTLKALNLDDLARFDFEGNTYYHCGLAEVGADIPELTLLSGFDPLIVSYVERGAVLPIEYKRAVILKSGICLPSIAVNGRVAGLWNIKKGEPIVEFFDPQPGRITSAAHNLVESILWRTADKI